MKIEKVRYYCTPLHCIWNMYGVLSFILLSIALWDGQTSWSKQHYNPGILLESLFGDNYAFECHCNTSGVHQETWAAYMFIALQQCQQISVKENCESSRFGCLWWVMVQEIGDSVQWNGGDIAFWDHWVCCRSSSISVHAGSYSYSWSILYKCTCMGQSGFT